MTTALSERPAAKDGTLMSVTEETIAQMATRFAALKINGINDKAGFLAVDNARKECKKARGVISTEHATLKADALKVCQTLDSMKRNLTGQVEAIENRLVSEIEAVEAEKARIQKEKDDAIYADRVRQLAEYDTFHYKTSIHEKTLRDMSPAQFAETLAQTVAESERRSELARKAMEEEAERQRIAAEQAEANRKEAERLAAERVEFEKQQAELAAERKRQQDIVDQKLAAERAELEAQRKEQERKTAELQAEANRLTKIESDRIAAEQQKQREAEAAERARIETEERIKREAAVAEAERVAKEATEKRALELRPAKQKLNVFAHSLIELEIPNISDLVNSQVQAVLNQAAESIRRIGANLS